MNKTKLMSKKKIIVFSIIICIAIIATFYFLGCNKKSFTGDINLNEISGQSSTVKAKPVDGSTPADHAPNDNFYYALGDLLSAGSFIGESEGSSTSLGVKQEIKATRYVNGKEVYKQSLSHSTFKSVGVEMFISGKNYVLRDADKLNSVRDVTWQSAPYKVSEETFIGKFGSVPNGITSYILTDNTIVSGEYLGESDGVYAFRYELDKTLATAKIRLEMRTMAGTKTLPNFEKAVLTVYMNSDWRIIRTETDCTYQVDMLGGVTCNESLTENFSSIGEGAEIPNAELFRPYLDAEITDVEDEEPDALYYLTNGFNEYMTGKPLNVSIELDGPVKAIGRASVDININDLAAIKARIMLESVKIGDAEINDIFIGYADEAAYIGYQDLKAKISVQDLTAALNKLIPLFTGQTDFDIDSLLSFDPQTLMTNATLTRANGFATVNLPLNLGGLNADIRLDFTDGETIGFTGITACVNGLKASVTPAEISALPETDDSFRDIAGLLDVIDENGNLCLKLNAAGITAVANVNLNTMEADAVLGDLKAKLLDGTVYISYQDLKIKAAADELSSVIDRFAPLSEGVGILSAFDEIDAETLLNEIIGGLYAKEENGILSLGSSVAGMNVAIKLYADGDDYGFKNIELKADDFDVSAESADASMLNSIDRSELNEFKNALSLLNLIDENYEINLSAQLVLGGETVSADICLNIEELSVTAAAELYGKPLALKYADNRIYLSWLGLNVYADGDDIAAAADFLAPLLGGINLDDFKLNLTEAIDSLTAISADNGVELSVSLGGISVKALLGYDGDNLKLENINLDCGGLTAEAAPSEKGDYSAFNDVSGFYDIMSLLSLIDPEGNIALDVAAGKFNAALNFNLFDMRLRASVLGAEILADFNTGKIYAVYNELRIALNLADADEIIKKLSPLFDTLAAAGMPAIDFDGLKNIDIESLLSSITVSQNRQNSRLTISLPIGGLTVNAVFDTSGNRLELTCVTAESDGVAFSVRPGNKTEFTELDLSADYIDLKAISDIVNENGEINLSAELTLNGFTAEADVCVKLDDLTVLIKTEIYGKPLYAKMTNGMIYASFGGLNVYLDTADAEKLIELIKPLLQGETDKIFSLDINADEILGSITAEYSDSGAIIGVTVAGFDVNATFTKNGSYSLSSVTASGSGITLSASPASAKANYSPVIDTQGFYNAATLTEIIDADGNISLTLDAGGMQIDLTFNLFSMRMNASVAGALITADFNAGKIYAAYGGARVMMNLSDAEYILNKLSPVFDKLISDGGILGAVDIGALKNVSLESVLSSLKTAEENGKLKAMVDIVGIDAELVFDTQDGNLRFIGATVDIGGTTCSAVPSAKLIEDLNLAESYTDLKQLVDIYGDTLVSLVTAQNLSLNIAGSVKVGDTVYTVEKGSIIIGGIDGETKINADMAVTAVTTAADGAVVSKSHNLRIVYDVLSKQAYFNYNGVEGIFTTEKLDKTLGLLKQIYDNIPELQELINGIIPMPDDGKLPEFAFDFSALINSLTLDGDERLILDINGKSAAAFLPASLNVILSAADGSLKLEMPAFTADSYTIALAIDASNLSDGDVAGSFDYVPGENSSDFSSVNMLLKTFANTSAFRNFKLSGKIDLSLLGFIDIKDKVNLDISIDIINGNTYVEAALKRDYVLSAWKDYDGTATLYYDGSAEMFYIKNIYRTRKLGFFEYIYTTHEEYTSYTTAQFTDNIVDILLGMIRLSDTYENLIRDAMNQESSGGSGAGIEDVFKKYSYNGADKFTLNLNMSKLTDDAIGDLTLDIFHTADEQLKSLALNTTVKSLLTIDFSATLTDNNENGTAAAIQNELKEHNYIPYSV